MERLLHSKNTVYSFYSEVLKNSLYSPAGGYLSYLKFAHSSTQTICYYIDIYLRDVILALSLEAGKK